MIILMKRQPAIAALFQTQKYLTYPPFSAPMLKINEDDQLHFSKAKRKD